MKFRLFGLLLAGLAALSVSAQEKVQTRVSVTSQPSGASVIVDGRDRGTTPTTLFDLKPGRHHLKLRLAGYEETDRHFSTDEGPFIEKSEILQEVKGLLLVRSDPPGASIVINGMTVGQTPRLITNLAAKDTYKVKLQKTGYQDQTLSVKFEGRTPLVCDTALVLSSGVLDILSEPTGANVTVNGIDRGQTPITVKDVPRGRAVVRYRLPGFADETRELAVNSGDRQTLSVVMKGLPGTLHLISSPEGARFYVNGEARGVGPMAIPNLSPGQYEIRAEKPGYGTVTKTITLANGQSTREEFKLSNVMGRLEVRTDPIGAQVLLDGHVVGVTKSAADADYSDVLAIDALLEGEHTLVIRKEGYAEVSRHPRIENSKTTVANVRLRRIFLPNIEIVTSRGNYRGVLKSKGLDGSVEVEVSLGITRTFSRDEIRKINMLGTAAKP